MANYSVEMQRSAQKELESIDDRASKERIAEKVRSLGNDPRPPGSVKLKGRLRTYRVRQGDYRIIYEIRDDVLVVLVIAIAHRSDAYR